MTAHVLARSDTGFVLEHACEMMRVIEAEHVCKNGSRKMIFLCNFCKIGSYLGNLCLYISWKCTNFALEIQMTKFENV